MYVIILRMSLFRINCKDIGSQTRKKRKLGREVQREGEGGEEKEIRPEQYIQMNHTHATKQRIEKSYQRTFTAVLIIFRRFSPNRHEYVVVTNHR